MAVPGVQVVTVDVAGVPELQWNNIVVKDRRDMKNIQTNITCRISKSDIDLTENQGSCACAHCKKCHRFCRLAWCFIGNSIASPLRERNMLIPTPAAIETMWRKIWTSSSASRFWTSRDYCVDWVRHWDLEASWKNTHSFQQACCILKHLWTHFGTDLRW